MKSEIKVPANLALTDLDFHKPGAVNTLIGCDLFYGLLRIGQFRLGITNPLCRGLGLAGYSQDLSFHPLVYFSRSLIWHKVYNRKSSTVDFTLEKFWELEETSMNKPLSAEENYFEEYVEKNVRHDSVERFILSIPFKDSTIKLGNYRTNADEDF